MLGIIAGVGMVGFAVTNLVLLYLDQQDKRVEKEFVEKYLAEQGKKENKNEPVQEANEKPIKSIMKKAKKIYEAPYNKYMDRFALRKTRDKHYMYLTIVMFSFLVMAGSCYIAEIALMPSGLKKDEAVSILMISVLESARCYFFG